MTIVDSVYSNYLSEKRTHAVDDNQHMITRASQMPKNLMGDKKRGKCC